MTTLAKFDAADYLDNEEVIAEYLTAALDDPNRYTSKSNSFRHRYR